MKITLRIDVAKDWHTEYEITMDNIFYTFVSSILDNTAEFLRLKQKESDKDL